MDSNVLYIRNIDDQLKREFKALCALRGKTLTEEIRRLMREELERRKKEIVNETDGAV
jgi:plasmid stability protein